MAPKKNLIYHVTPFGNYLWNLDQLAKRIHLFNGVKLIAVAQGNLKDGTPLTPLSEVKQHLPLGVTAFPVENDINLRETASLLPLLERLHDSAPGADNITFYAHTKGTSRQDEHFKMKEAIRLWTEIMYGQLLDNISGVEAHLEKAPCVGCFKRYGRFGHFPRTSKWHYSGTFFWFRNRDLFLRSWRDVPRMRYGAEGYLSTLFGPEESACIFGEGVTDLYNVQYLRRVMSIKNGNVKSIRGRVGSAATKDNAIEEKSNEIKDSRVRSGKA